uniref:Bromodomain associated domain-containing protein n=1 Tax=Romanomermis culicivorax TaxID=13658 RepID=A0A915HFF4_ROMCU
MTYSDAPVNMILHRVGRTLLIDDLDVYKNVLSSKEHTLKWLRKFMSDNINPDSSAALVPTALSRQDLEARLMLSKFLYHSLDPTNADNEDGNISSIFEAGPTNDVPDPLGDSMPGNSFERNVLWNFEDIRMLIGTDLPIFGAGTHPCVTLRLKDMKKPISVLTGIDYWLDQLMCTVPEVVMCYHLNGIVQRYEIIKTEDLPSLPESSFSAELVRDVAQNILSFLKNNATKEGHTYWLFKDKDDDIVKLYDLTSVCSEYMDENDANPFTLPVAVLMYRVARNLLQYSSKSRKNVANTVYKLLTHCLKLLDAQKFPQVAGSVHYYLANLYMTYGKSIGETKSGSSKSHNSQENKDDIENNNGGNDEEDYFDDDFDWYAEDTNNRLVVQQQRLAENSSDEGFSCVSLECLSNRTVVNQTTDVVTSENRANLSSSVKRMFIPNCSNVEDCWQSALEHVLKGLDCIDGEKNRKDPKDTEAQLSDPGQPIPLPYESLNRSSNSSSLVSTSSILPMSVRNPNNTEWRFNLLSLLLTKAIKNYELLGDYAFALQRFGKALRYVKLGFLCYESAKKLVADTEFDTEDSNHADNIDGLPLSHSKRVIDVALPKLLLLCGDIHCVMSQEKIADMDRHMRDYNASMYRDKKISDRASSLMGETALQYAYLCEISTSIERNLKLSQECYEKVLMLLNDKEKLAFISKASAAEKVTLTRVGKSDVLNSDSDNLISTFDSKVILTRLGNVKNCLGIYYMNLSSALSAESKDAGGACDNNVLSTEDNSRDVIGTVENCWSLSFTHFQEGIEIFQRIGDKDNQALLNSNAGRLMRTCAVSYYNSDGKINCDEEHYLNKFDLWTLLAVNSMQAIEMYQRALECVNPNGASRTWETIAWELSSAYFTYATQLQDRPPISTTDDMENVQKKIADLMQKSLKLLDTLDIVDKAKHAVYLYRASIIHHKLGSLYHTAYRNKEFVNDRKSKQYRSLAELHYRKSSDGFKETVIDTPVEFINIQIERAVLLEGDVEGLSNASSKLRIYCQALDTIVQCRSAFMSLCRRISCSREGQDAIAEKTACIMDHAIKEHQTKKVTDFSEEIEVCKLTLHRLRTVIKECLRLTRSAVVAAKMTEKYARSIVKIALAQVAKTIGFNSVSQSTFDVLQDLFVHYLQQLCDNTRGRNQPIIDDVGLALVAIGVSIREFQEYLMQVGPMEFPKKQLVYTTMIILFLLCRKKLDSFLYTNQLIEYPYNLITFNSALQARTLMLFNEM